MTTHDRQPPTCKGCIHFYVTYDANFPYGCRILQFKSRRPPHLEVQAASQAPCMAHEPGARKKSAK